MTPLIEAAWAVLYRVCLCRFSSTFWIWRARRDYYWRLERIKTHGKQKQTSERQWSSVFSPTRFRFSQANVYFLLFTLFLDLGYFIPNDITTTKHNAAIKTNVLRPTPGAHVTKNVTSRPMYVEEGPTSVWKNLLKHGVRSVYRPKSGNKVYIPVEKSSQTPQYFLQRCVAPSDPISFCCPAPLQPLPQSVGRGRCALLTNNNI